VAAAVVRDFGGKSANNGAAIVASPSNMVTGDMDLMVAAINNVGSLSITADGGGAWTPLPGITWPVAVASGMKLYAWYRIRQVGDGNPTITPAGSVPFIAERGAIEVGTFDPSSPFEAQASGTETTSDNTFSFTTGVSTTGVDRLVFVVTTILRDSNTSSCGMPGTNAALTNYGLAGDHCTNLGTGGGIGWARGEKATAGSTGTFESFYGASSRKAYATFAIKPLNTTTVSPASQTRTPELGSPTVSPQLLPASVVQTRALGATTLSQDTTAAPGALEHTRAIGSPTVNPQIRPSGQARTRAVGSPTVSTTVRPAGLARTRELGSPSVQSGITISPAAIAHTRGTSTPTVNVTATGASVVQTRGIGTPSIKATLAPAAVSHTRGQGTVTVTRLTQIAPGSVSHTRGIGAPTAHVAISPTSGLHTRGIGTPRVSPQLRPGSIEHGREVGSPIVPEGILPSNSFLPMMHVG
jgi:hypothetical protein